MEDAYLGHDFNVRACELMKRPDMLFGFSKFALLIEIDEHAHRGRDLMSELSHLEVIREWLKNKHSLERLYVLRVNPDGRMPMFKRSMATNGEQIWSPTPVGETKMQQVVEYLSPVIRAGLESDSAWIDECFGACPPGIPVHLGRLFFS